MPTPTRAPRRQVSDPIITRVEHDGPEWVIRPCTALHRNYVLRGLIPLSCKKCMDTMVKLAESEWAS